MANEQFLSMVRKACRHDHDAFVALCEAKANYIFYYCKRHLQNQQDAEDAAQEVFVRMQKSIAKLAAPEAFNTWLNKLLAYTCFDVRQNRMKEQTNISIDEFEGEFISDTLESLPQEYVEDAALRREIVSLIDNLPDKYRQCVLLHYYQNFSYSEAAEILGVSPAVVKHNLNMARKHLRVELEDKVGAWRQNETPMLAFSPAVTAILDQSAQEAAVFSVAQQCMTAAGVYTAFLSGGAAVAATATAAGAGSSIATFFTGPVIKGLISAAVATGVATAVLFATASPPLPANVPVAGDPQRLPQTASGYEDTASPLDAAIPDAPGPAQTLSVPGTGTVSGEAGAVAAGSGAGTAGSGTGFSEKPAAVSEAAVTPAAPAAPAEPAQAASQTAKLKGSVVFKKADGTVIPGGGKYAAGFDVTLKQDENVITRTKVDAAGTYAFNTVNIEEAGEYTIVIAPPSSRSTGFAAENPVGTLTVSLEAEAAAGEAAVPVTAPVLYITDTTPPEVGLSLLDAAGEKCAVNPVKAEITIADETGTACRWQVVTQDGSRVLYSGAGETVALPFAKMKPAGQTGDHVLKVTVTDAAGNVTETQQVFCIT